MKNILKKISAVAMAFTILGTGVAITESISHSSLQFLTAEAKILTAEAKTITYSQRKDGIIRERQIYNFLTNGGNGFTFNNAIACGIIANMSEETFGIYDPTTENPVSTNKKYGKPYGICQWKDDRLENLDYYATKVLKLSSYKETSLYDQLAFMKLELTKSAKENGFPKTNLSNYRTDCFDKLTDKNTPIENNENGAYRAAEIWCEFYEGYKAGKTIRAQKAKEMYNPNKTHFYTAIVTANPLNVRSARNTTDDKNVVFKYNYGESLTIYDVKKGWGKVSTFSNLWVYLDYLKVNNMSGRFNDVKTSYKYYDAIEYVFKNQIMIGKGQSFGYNDILQREEFAQVLYNYEGKPDINGATTSFNDVIKGKWYYNAIVWAQKKGVVAGYDKYTFGVGDELTREQVVQMLYNYAKNYMAINDDPTIKQNPFALIKTSGQSSNFTKDDWAKDAMDWAATQGIISSSSWVDRDTKDKIDDHLDAKLPATRAECADMLMNFFQKAKKIK